MRYISLLIVLIAGLTVFGKQTEDYYFRQISIEDGLSQSTVLCSTKDYKGFIWIGTQNGLNYYDHSKLISFMNEPGDSTSLPGNRIFCILDGPNHNLWVGTDKGVAHYDRTYKVFHRLSLNGRPVFASDIIQLPDNNLLLCGRNTIYKYVSAKKRIEELPLKNNSERTPEFSKMARWDDDRILLTCTDGILWVYEPKQHHIYIAPFYKHHDVKTFFVDAEGNLWLSPYGKGVIHFDKEGEQIAHYNTNNSGLNNNRVLAILEDSSHKDLWIGTHGGGINILHLADNSFSYIQSTPGYDYSLPSNIISNLYRDSLNNFWAGTPHDGLVGIKRTFVRTFSESAPGSTIGMSSKATLNFCDDGRYIWIGTDGGINRFDPEKEEFLQYPQSASFVIRNIENFSSDELLIAVNNKGIFRFNKASGSAMLFAPAEVAYHNSDREIRDEISMARITPDLYLFMADSIVLYDRASSKVAMIRTPLMPKSGAPSELRYVTTVDSSAYLYDNRRIYQLSIAGQSLQPIYRLPREYGTINAVVRHDGSFWLGTSTGLYVYNIERKECRLERSYRVMEVSSVIAGEPGHLWIGANGMIYNYSIKDKTFTHLDESDGVSINDFLPQATLRCRNGNIYMGGTRGFSRISSKNQMPLQVAANVELSDVLLNGVSLIEGLTTEEPVVTLPYDYDSFSVKLLANKEYLFRKKIYRYYVEGFTKTMPIITYDSHVRLHNLSPGKYTLIASSNIGSTWSEPKPLLHIIVTPPWWDSTWVILGIIALILLIFFLVHKWIIYRKNQSMAQTMLEHDREMQEDRVLFLTNINHELRTPLTLIHAPIKQMLDHGQLSADVRRQLTRVYKHTKQMRNIINMVLDMRKMESVDSALNIAAQALNDWLAAIAEDYSYEFAEKQITLTTSFDETVGSVQYDPKRMETVVTNILINAFKFSTPGTTVTLATKRVDDRVRIEISDEGIGINEEDIEHLFTCFFQGRNHSMPGTGLGLPYAKRLVELHHGIIGAYNNTTGRGATFFFELPIEQPEGATADKAAIRFSETYEDSTTIILSPDDFSTMAGRSILVVEDEPEMRDYLADLLRPKFAKVYTADNGADALILIKQHLPDIVISDIMMARVNGLQLCQQVKSDNDLSHIPFVLLTAKTDSDSIMTGYKAGADAYLEKPFDPDYLLARLSALLRNKTNMKEHYKNYKTAADESTPTPHSNTDEQFILRLNNLIESQLDNCDLDVKFITDTMGIGRATLYTRMKQLLGVGVNDYINRYRIAKARDLLLTTNLSVQEIATMCGFSNQRYFSTVFKQAKGFAPTHYRERFASNPEDAA